MKSGVFGLVDPLSKKIRYVSCSIDVDRAAKKYIGNLKKTVGSPSVYRWLCELQMQDLKIAPRLLEECPEESFTEIKTKWVNNLQNVGEADLNINFSGKIK